MTQNFGYVINTLKRVKLMLTMSLNFFVPEISRSYQRTVYKGPALKIYKPPHEGSYENFDEDLIFCFNCPFWPPEASEWITRGRDHKWPSQEDIALVVENGCHIVPVAHIDCSKDEYQWRISFSKAELILIKSWSPGQQYVYHLLRYFAKKELLNEDWKNTDEILSTHALKTLMLWQCERKSNEWWHFESDRELCCKLLRLLKLLLHCLLRLKCQNYFIKNCNLFAHTINIANYNKTIYKLRLFGNVDQVKEWFYVNYLPKEYPDHRDTLKLSNRAIALANSKSDESLYKFMLTSDCVKLMSVPEQAGFVSCEGRRHSIPLSQERCLRQIGLIEGVFVDFYKAHVLLQVATKYTTGQNSDHHLAMLSSLFLNQPRFWEKIPPIELCDVFLMIERERYYELAEYVLAGHTTNYETDHHLQIILGKTLIKKELKLFNNKPYNECFNRKLLLHLAALYFASKRYGSCIKQLALASNLHKFQRSSSDQPASIDSRYLGFVDEVVFAIGLLQLTHASKIEPMFINTYMTNLDFLSGWMSCLSLLRQSSLMKQYDYRILKSCRLLTQTDIFLF